MTSTLLRRLRARSGSPERGSSVVEVVILAPALGMFVALIIAGGRVALSHQAVESAAADAARAASISRTQGQAASNAETAAAASLSSQNLRCVSTSVSIETAGFASPVGPRLGWRHRACQVDLAGLLPAPPRLDDDLGHHAIPLDTYRER